MCGKGSSVHTCTCTYVQMRANSDQITFGLGASADCGAGGVGGAGCAFFSSAVCLDLEWAWFGESVGGVSHTLYKHNKVQCQH